VVIFELQIIAINIINNIKIIT